MTRQLYSTEARQLTPLEKTRVRYAEKRGQMTSDYVFQPTFQPRVARLGRV